MFENTVMIKLYRIKQHVYGYMFTHELINLSIKNIVFDSLLPEGC